MSTSNCTRFRALACGALLVAFVLAGATSAHAATRPDCPNADVEPTASDTDDVRAAVLCLINADRTQRRLTPLGENLAWGTGDLGTARGVQSAWMRSPGHRANILKAAYRELGIGVHAGVPTDAGAGATFTTDFGAKG